MKNNKQEKFSDWIERFLTEKEIDKYEIFTIDRNGEKHVLKIENVVEMMKITTQQEQKAIKNMLVKIDLVDGDVRDYIKHLGNALVDTYSNVKTEEVEDETM